MQNYMLRSHEKNVSIKILQRLQNLCNRFVFGLREYDHGSHLQQELKWLPICLRRNTRILCLLFTILHNTTYPSYQRERFS